MMCEYVYFKDITDGIGAAEEVVGGDGSEDSVRGESGSESDPTQEGHSEVEEPEGQRQGEEPVEEADEVAGAMAEHDLGKVASYF